MVVENELIHLNAADNWLEYHKKRVSIVNIYNNSNKYHREVPEINPDTLEDKRCLHSFSFKNHAGGILIESLIGNEAFALITFAGLNQKDRGKGFGASLVQQATNVLKDAGVDLIGVQMNEFDDKGFWIKQGFTEAVPFGNGLALILPDK